MEKNGIKAGNRKEKQGSIVAIALFPILLWTFPGDCEYQRTL